MSRLTKAGVPARYVTLVALTALAFASGTAAGQTRWFKYAGNPVLDLGPPGAWDDHLAAIESVVIQEGVAHAWYTGSQRIPGLSRFGYATSTDGGITWTKHPSNPVMSESPDSWDSFGLLHAYVLPSDAGFRMWYTGYNNAVFFRIGYATSEDGINWTKHPPYLIDGATGSWNLQGVLHPSVVERGDSLIMWFQGVNAHTVGMATATDDTTWIPYANNPVFVDNVSIYYGRVKPVGEKLGMWYGSSSVEIRYATSEDGISWERSSENPVLRSGSSVDWDGQGIAVSDVHFDGSMYHMWYQGYPIDRTGYAISPAGSRIEADQDDATDGVARIGIRVDDPTDLRFTAILERPNFTGPSFPVDTLDLFDDGLHGDGMAGDGFFANTWKASETGTYRLNLDLVWRDTLAFHLRHGTTLRVEQIAGVEIQEAAYTPDDYEDGALEATFFVPHPATANGTAVILGRYTDADRLTARAWCDTLAARGYLAMTIDYGNLDVSTYPKPQRAFKTAVEFLRRDPTRFGVAIKRIVGFGQSQGSIIWGQTLAWDNDDAFFGTDPGVDDGLDGAVLLYGAYDMFNALLPAQNSILTAHFATDPLYRGTRGQAISNASRVQTPVLLIHGTADAIVDVSHSRAFRDSLLAYGREVKLVEIDGAPHIFDLTNTGEFTEAGLTALSEVLDWIPATVGTASAPPAVATQPASLRLDQNHPNPFNPSTTITFAVPRADRVQLAVYDVTGRQVAVLLDREMALGSHAIDFDGTALASGVYLYRLTAGAFTESRLMILQK